MNVAHASIFKRQWFQVGFSTLVAVVFLAMAILPTAAISSQKPVSVTSNANADYSSMVNNSTISRAEAGGLFAFACGGIGYNMNQASSWGRKFGSIPLEDKPNRRFTLQEAFGNSLRFTSYYGEGEGEDFVRSKEEDPPEFVTVDKPKLEAERTTESCIFSRISLSLATGGFVLADAVTMITQLIVSVAFDPNLVCNRDETSSNDDSCLDLISVIGGESNDDDSSIIGSLTNSLYFPLLTIAGILVGVYLVWQGMAKRQLRKAFGGALYSMLIIILGCIAVLNPVLLTKAPMTVSSVAANCILGAFSGQDCIGGTHDGVNSDGSMQNGKSSSELICSSAASGTGYTDQMQLTINSTTCQIWKSFVLNPYSIAAFGLPFDELDTKDPDAKGSEFVAAAEGVTNDDFCVNLSSTRSAEEMENETLQLDSTSNGGRICNIAAYQLYLMTNAESGNDSRPESGEYDERWYRIVEVAGNNDDMWGAWTSSSVSGMTKLGISLIAVLITLVGNFIILVTGLFAVVYYISGIILMAFAPIFLLIGVHPGRGRQIMLGWLEKVISNVLKYIVSAAFVVVTVGIYGGVLAANVGLDMTIVFVIVVTMALFMYRREFIEMIGRANMGGEQISSSMADKLRSKSDEGRDLALAGVGGAIGSKVAGGTVKGGFNAGIKRDLKRGTGFIANTAREFDNVKNNTRGNLERQIETAKRIKDADRQERLTNALERNGYDSELNPAENKSGNDNVPVAGNRGRGPVPNQRGRDGQIIENEMQQAVHDYEKAKEDVSQAEEKEKNWNSYIDAKNDIAVELQNDPALMQDLVNSAMSANPDLTKEEITPLAEHSIQLFAEDVRLQNEDAALAGRISSLTSVGRHAEAAQLQNRRDEISERRSQINEGLNSQTFDKIKGHYDNKLETSNIPTPEGQAILNKLNSIDTSNSNPEEVRAFEEYRIADGEFEKWSEMADRLSANGDENGANQAYLRADEASAKREEILANNPNNKLIKEMGDLQNQLSNSQLTSNHDDNAKIEAGFAESTSEKIDAGARVVAAKSSLDAIKNAQTEKQEQEHTRDEMQTDMDNYERQKRARSDIELDHTERALEGLHPDEGISRRKLRELRRQTGEELKDEGYEVNPKRYGRKRSRQDVRGEKLFDDSRGVPMPLGQDVPLPEPPQPMEPSAPNNDNYKGGGEEPPFGNWQGGNNSGGGGTPVNPNPTGNGSGGGGGAIPIPTPQESPRQQTIRQETPKDERPPKREDSSEIGAFAPNRERRNDSPQDKVENNSNGSWFNSDDNTKPQEKTETKFSPSSRNEPRKENSSPTVENRDSQTRGIFSPRKERNENSQPRKEKNVNRRENKENIKLPDEDIIIDDYSDSPRPSRGLFINRNNDNQNLSNGKNIPNEKPEPRKPLPKFNPQNFGNNNR